jgi:hypothetical protein
MNNIIVINDIVNVSGGTFNGSVGIDSVVFLQGTSFSFNREAQITTASTLIYIVDDNNQYWWTPDGSVVEAYDALILAIQNSYITTEYLSTTGGTLTGVVNYDFSDFDNFTSSTLVTKEYVDTEISGITIDTSNLVLNAGSINTVPTGGTILITTVGWVKINANAVGPNGFVELTSICSRIGANGNITIRTYFTNTEPTIGTGTPAGGVTTGTHTFGTGTLTAQFDRRWYGNGTTTGLSSFPVTASSAAGPINSSTIFATVSVNTNQDWWIVYTYQLANQNDQFAIRGCNVRICK